MAALYQPMAGLAPRQHHPHRIVAGWPRAARPAERDRGGIAAMLAADAQLQVALGAAALLCRDADHLADAVDVDRNERVLWQDARLDIVRQELAGIVARQAKHGLRQVVGA